MRGPLLGQAALFAALLVLVTCLTGSHVCPRTLDCARAGRHFCQQGSNRCGPCLHPLVENSHGHCVVRRRQAAHSALSITGQVITPPELDEEIDFLSAIITEQRTESRLPAPPSKDVSRPKSMHLEVFNSFHEGSSAETLPSQSTATPTTTTTNHTAAKLNNPIILPYPSNDRVFIIVSSFFIVAGSLALIIAGTCWVRLQKGVRLTRKVDYPVYGLMTAQTFEQEPGDKKLANSAQMFHYQHQKQQMLSLEKHRDEPKVPDSGASSDEENEAGDFTVYECPGLAPTGEMEVMNPLFDDTILHFQRLNK